jgi:hypothetical protein
MLVVLSYVVIASTPTTIRRISRNELENLEQEMNPAFKRESSLAHLRYRLYGREQ